MIKIRLHGTTEEVENAAKIIRASYNILSESDDYSDRGKSLYVRRYIDAEQPDILGGELTIIKNGDITI